ncbi:hypothetical protein Mapa_005068 [Marchantia paleacea]|nr:hypothetical protein Mapa_005068 [Marchantia paleacea]
MSTGNVEPVSLTDAPVLHNHGTPLSRLRRKQAGRQMSRRQGAHGLLLFQLRDRDLILRLPVPLYHQNTTSMLDELRQNGASSAEADLTPNVVIRIVPDDAPGPIEPAGTAGQPGSEGQAVERAVDVHGLAGLPESGSLRHLGPRAPPVRERIVDQSGPLGGVFVAADSCNHELVPLLVPLGDQAHHDLLSEGPLECLDGLLAALQSDHGLQKVGQGIGDGLDAEALGQL